MTSLRRYALSVVDTVRQPLLLLARDYRVVAANRAFYRTFETTESNTVGVSVFEVMGRAWDSPGFRDTLALVLPQTEKVRDLEITVTSATTGQRHFLVDASRLEDPDRTENLILLAFEDRTVELDAERRSRLAHDELSRSNRELEEFASIASHDLQEPLRKIRAFGQRLDARAGATLDDTSKDFLRRMLNAAERMTTLIDDVLRVARVGHGSLTLAPIDLNAMIAEIAGADPAVTVERLPSVLGDASQLRQLFENLIDNARKFQRPGVAPAIAISASDDERAGYVAVTVADNGIGIEPQYRAQIFGMFRRLHGLSEYTGTGIGLALCRRIVERHGGRIDVESVVGEGSRFTVHLPRSFTTERLET
ncbi:MAG TPA: ATP-binding protein [Vicinamibacterales bacterium]|nr:ATP-binding protein [Vicinamibacterales bacterium]